MFTTVATDKCKEFQQIHTFYSPWRCPTMHHNNLYQDCGFWIGPLHHDITEVYAGILNSPIILCKEGGYSIWLVHVTKHGCSHITDHRFWPQDPIWRTGSMTSYVTFTGPASRLWVTVSQWLLGSHTQTWSQMKLERHLNNLIYVPCVRDYPLQSYKQLRRIAPHCTALHRSALQDPASALWTHITKWL